MFCSSNYAENRDESSLLEGIENSFVYIGTISEWFDWNNIIKVLNDIPELNIVLFGPIRTSYVPNHKRLIFKGTIDQSQVPHAMSAAKGLIMPFIVNDLIKSVNPVKLYEYICSGKPILASRYLETEKFSKYVTLYSDYQELYDFFKRSLQGTSNLPIEEMRLFASHNTWEYRCREIQKLLE